MNFKNYIRNEFGKTDTPENTIRNIVAGFDRLGYDIQYMPFQFSDQIHWSNICIYSINMECQGKGLTPLLSKASAHAELAERFSGGLFFQAFEEQVRFNMPALYSREVNRFLNYEWLNGYVNSHQDNLKTEYLSVETLLSSQSHLTSEDIKEIKNSQLARHWVDGYSIMQDKTVKVPINFIAYINASNGMAAGNTLEEAIIQATCEVFERHTQIQIIKPEQTIPTIDMNTLKNDRLKSMIAFYENENVEIILKDFSMGGQFPSIGVLFINHNLRVGRLEHKILIPGVSLNLEEALSRCLTEYMQGRSTLMTSRPDMDRPVIHRSRISNFYLLFKCCVSQKDISFLEKGDTIALRDSINGDILSEIEAIKKVCRDLDTDLIVLDLTHPVLEFPVVRVVMPGISDFLPFVYKDILTSADTSPGAVWRGEHFKNVMNSFF
ncbi:YcaO-like family protein [Desulfonema magnum]|uniref:YcaO-like domain-containing protein n=1 Tax=Desulfonema magnum TaxID=45655 RepID=A0A975BQ89_9BACT|nr:YcaO-like family protein [Desulfonema magnum]QTA89661.1 YcaO-like domain-containing protein [Desulfonema magnum]